jgi:hypothetical protein
MEIMEINISVQTENLLLVNTCGTTPYPLPNLKNCSSSKGNITHTVLRVSNLDLYTSGTGTLTVSPMFAAGNNLFEVILTFLA